MKFLLFSDLHYAPGVFRSLEWEALRTFQRRAEENGCDMILHCGDFTYPEKHRDFVEAYNSFHIPSYHCFGNHDMDGCTMEEARDIYKMPADYYFFDMGGYRFIITNTSYFVKDGEPVPYSNANYFAYPETRETLPPAQLAWLEETVSTSPYPCIIASHSSYERIDGVKNRQAVLDIINAANRRKKHSVLMCINGHHHRDNFRILDGVLYFDVNSASYDWIENTHNLYPAEECEKCKCLNHTVCYNDALSAVVTLEGTTVTVDGCESSMYLGINREQAGARIYDCMGRAVTPRIQSVKITL